MTTAVIACGALASGVRQIARRRGWDVDVHPVPALLHNRPERIAPAVRSEIDELRSRYDVLACAYGDCGTYGALDAALDGTGVERLPGEHCFELYAGAKAYAQLQDAEIGTFYLTDFLARQFETLVVAGLGLDRHPELLPLYFGNYTRLLHLAQTDDPALDAKAEAAAAFIKFMSSAESQAFIADKLGVLPGNADAYDMVTNERVALWADAMEVAQPRPWIPEGGQFFAALDTMATEVLIQGKPVQQSLDKAADTYKSDVVPDYSLQ
jgi:hypothetical protein